MLALRTIFTHSGYVWPYIYTNTINDLVRRLSFYLTENIYVLLFDLLVIIITLLYTYKFSLNHTLAEGHCAEEKFK